MQYLIFGLGLTQPLQNQLIEATTTHHLYRIIFRPYLKCETLNGHLTIFLVLFYFLLLNFQIYLFHVLLKSKWCFHVKYCANPYLFSFPLSQDLFYSLKFLIQDNNILILVSSFYHKPVKIMLHPNLTCHRYQLYPRLPARILAKIQTHNNRKILRLILLARTPIYRVCFLVLRDKCQVGSKLCPHSNSNNHRINRFFTSSSNRL